MGFVMTTFSSVTLSISFHFPICKENPFSYLFSFITVRKHSMCDFDKIRKGAENTEGRANGQGSRAVTKHCWCLLIGQNYYFFFPRKKRRSRFWLAKTRPSYNAFSVSTSEVFFLFSPPTKYSKAGSTKPRLRRNNKAFAEKKPFLFK